MKRKIVDFFEVSHLFLISISAAVAWSIQYFPGAQPLVERISFKINDPSWVPDGFEAKPILGEHYFGDFELFYAWAKEANPYTAPYPAQHLPTGQLLLKFFPIFPIEIAYLLYLGISLALLFVGAHVLTQRQRLSSGITRTTIIFGVLSLPTIVDFDRGNTQTIVVSLVACFIGLGLNKNYRSALLVLLIAISLKPYLILISLAFIRRSNFGTHLKFLSGFGLVNVALMLVFSPNLVYGFYQWAVGMSRYAGESGLGWIAHSGSLVGAIYRQFEFFVGFESSFEVLKQSLWVVQLVSIAMVVLALVIWHQEGLPTWIRVAGLFSIISVAQAGSGAYQWVWVGLVVVFYLHSHYDDHKQFLGSRFERLYLQIVAGLALIPTWILFPSPGGTLRSITNFMFVSPLILAGFILALLLLWRNHVRSTKLAAR